MNIDDIIDAHIKAAEGRLLNKDQVVAEFMAAIERQAPSIAAMIRECGEPVVDMGTVQDNWERQAFKSVVWKCESKHGAFWLRASANGVMVTRSPDQAGFALDGTDGDIYKISMTLGLFNSEVVPIRSF